MIPNLWKRSRRWLPGLLISLVAVALLITTVDWSKLGLAFAAFDWRFIPLFTIFYFAATGSRAMTSRTLLGGKVTFKQSFVAMMQGYLLNNVLPFRLGEFGRAFLLGRSSGLGMLHVLSTLVIERAYDLAIAAVCLLVTLPLALGASWMRPAAYTTLGLVFLALVTLYLMARYRVHLRTRFELLANRSAFVSRHVFPRIDSLFDGLSALNDVRRFMLSLFWISLTWLFGITNYYVLLHGLLPDVTLWHVVFGIGVVSMGIALPSAPASIGVFEGMLVAALTLVGIDSATALAYAVLLHLLHIIYSGLIGLYGFVREGETIMGVYDQIAKKRN